MKFVSPRNVTHAHGLLSACLVLCLAICSTRQISGSTDSASALLKVFGQDGNFAQYRVYPEERAKMLFPTAEAWEEKQQDTDAWSIRAAPILKKIHILRVGDMARRFTVTGVSTGDQLFIFDGLFCSENSEAMSELIKATNSAPKNRLDALNLVKLYLALSRYQDDPNKFVAMRSGKPRLKNDPEGPRTFSDLVGVAHSPQVLREAGGYLVDLYTRELTVTGGAAIHWKIKLTPSGFDEEMSSVDKAADRVLPEGNIEKNAGNKRVTFQVDLMANGHTDDGAVTDIQLWSASDGPGISRVHYYYPSREKAEKRMEDFLQNALGVLQNIPWKSAEGRTPDAEAIVIRVNADKRSLYASHLYLNEASILELSCSCLRNVLAGRSIDDARSHN
jgi:hypothetical protein